MTGSITVLHVDDEPDFTDMVASFLEGADERLEVVTEQRPADALDRLDDGSDIDCVVSDYEMPGMDGLAFLDGVRERYPDLPFVLYTGKGSEEVASEAIARGATDYLQKRTGTEQYELLANRVANAVEQFRSERRARKLERIRGIVGEVNRALVRAESRETIERRVCDVLGGADPYSFAWVGDVVDGGDEVVPRATSDDSIPLDRLRVTTDDSPHGQGPVGRAFETHEIQVVQDTATFDLEEWQAFAATHDIGSLAVVPLVHDGTCYGILDVYAARERTFDAEEQALLAELGDDVAHAIYTQDIRRELAATKREYEAVIERARCGLALVDVEPDGFSYRQFNPRMEEMTGLTADEVRDTALDDRLDDADAAKIESAYRTCLDRGEPVEYRVTLDLPAGEVVQDCTVSPVRTGDGTDQLVVVVRDVTDEQRQRRERDSRAARLEVLFDNSPDMIDVLDAEGRVVETNDRFCSKLGYPASDVVGTPIWEYDQLVDADAVASILDATTTEDARKFEGRYERADGSTIPVEIHLTELPLAGEERYMAISRDITERKRRERERERTIERVTDAVVTVDADWRFTMVDERAEEIYGIAESDLLGRDFWTVFKGALETRFEEEYRTAMQTREPTTLEAYYDGLDEWFHVEVYPDPSGGLSFYFHEISERKAHEQKLRRSERHFEAIFEDPQILVGLLDPDGTLRRINQTAMAFVDADRETVLGDPFWETPWWTGDDDTDIRSCVERAAGDEYVEFEATLARPDGAEYTVDGTIRPVTDDGHVVSLIVSARDITERRRRERELERQNERLDEFASVVSHDLRNPLNVAVGRLELAQDECDSTYLDDVERAHDRMDELIGDLLTLAREGEAATDLEPVPLAEKARDCWETVQTSDASLETPAHGVVRADESRLTQLIENLVRNAVDHGTAGAGPPLPDADHDSVTVTVGDLDGGFYVADDGPGIPPDERDDIFDAGYSTSVEGTGFGLNIVQRIADAHDWSVDVTESQSGGARFEITGVDRP